MQFAGFLVLSNSQVDCVKLNYCFRHVCNKSTKEYHKLNQVESITNPLLTIKNLHVDYVQSAGWFSTRKIHAVRNLSFEVAEAEIVGVVGESGCGKSTLARAILQLTAVSSGQIIFLDKPVLQLGGQALRDIRRSMQMVFQDPLSSLDPRMRIGRIIAEPLIQFYPHLSSRQQSRHVEEIIQQVELPANVVDRFAHQLSGGQCQRVSIARALICKPALLVCDEAVSALDVSVQAQILNLLRQLTADFNMSLLFISHDLRVIRQLCDRVLVMYQGQLIETASCDDLFEHPKHAYTKKLIAAIPAPQLWQK
jgi:oligopeptide transport system ATP-binding protein